MTVAEILNQFGFAIVAAFAITAYVWERKKNETYTQTLQTLLVSNTETMTKFVEVMRELKTVVGNCSLAQQIHDHRTNTDEPTRKIVG